MSTRAHTRLAVSLSAVAAVALGAAALAVAPRAMQSGADFEVPNTFQAGTPARASEVNENFDAVGQEIQAASAERLALSDELSILVGQVAALPSPANLIVVATSGGHFDSVAAALASITDSAADNPYTVFVAPGVYSESEICAVPSFVHLMGAGAASTRVTSERSGNAPNSDAATVALSDLAALSAMTVENSGSAASHAIGVVGFELSRDTLLEELVVLANGAGGVGHYAVYTGDSDLTIRDSVLRASGASTVNAAYGSVDSGGPFAQPLIVDSILEAKVVNSGFGMQMMNTAARVEGSTVVGWFRSISASVNGTSLVRDSRVETLGGSAVYETTGGAAILSGTTFFVAGNPVGNPSSFKYVHCIKPNHDPITDGLGSDVD